MIALKSAMTAGTSSVTVATFASIATIYTGIAVTSGMTASATGASNKHTLHTHQPSNKKPPPNKGRLFPYQKYYFFFSTFAIVAPISAGVCTTVIPHSAMIFIFAAAVSSAPPMIAPACPIRRPAGAV
jgi:hypothetical protein